MTYTLPLILLMLCLSSCRTASARDDVDEERLRRMLKSNDIEIVSWEEGRLDHTILAYCESAFGFEPDGDVDAVIQVSYRCAQGDSISRLTLYRCPDSLDAIAMQSSIDSVLALPSIRFDDVGFFDFIHHSSFARIGRLVCEFTLDYGHEPDENCMAATLLPLREP